MLIRASILALLIFGCNDTDSGPAVDAGNGDATAESECGPRPGGCDDVPEDFASDPACGTTICGAWEYCECQDGEWKVTYIDCFGCGDAGP